jgi:signal peptidase II
LEFDVKNLKKFILSYLVLVSISGIVVGLDQWTKYLVRTNLQLGEEWVPLPDIAPFLRVVHWKNTGAAFGLLPQASVVFTIIAILVTIAIIYYWPRIPSNQIALRLALALQLGGALGNLTSRLVEGIVTDWIAVGNFPVFNVADSSITIGVTILILTTWFEERRKGGENLAEEHQEEIGHEEKIQEADPAG